MKVRTYGFTFDKTLLPPAIPRAGVFEQMAAHPGGRVGNSYQIGAAKVTLPCGARTQDWWGGMIIRIRDSQGYLKLTERGGKATLTTEHLAEGEKLAEVSFFLAHPETGNGLLTHHYHATSIFSFGRVCSRVFSGLRKGLLQEALAVAPLTLKERKTLAASFKGKLSLSQLCFDTNLKELVKKLERVNSFDFSFTTVKTKERIFRGIAERAESERIKFTFPADVDVDALAEEIEPIMKEENVSELRVHGVDHHGVTRDYRMNQNPLIFAEYDYDDMMRGLKLDLSNWQASIQKSGAIAHLGKVAAGNSVFHLLSKA